MGVTRLEGVYEKRKVDAGSPDYIDSADYRFPSICVEGLSLLRCDIPFDQFDYFRVILTASRDGRLVYLSNRAENLSYISTSRPMGVGVPPKIDLYGAQKRFFERIYWGNQLTFFDLKIRGIS
jgi:hypothetical protein